MKTKLLISVDELADRLDQVSLIDTRPVHQFLVGHLPNALSLDLFYLSLKDVIYTDHSSHICSFYCLKCWSLILRDFLQMILHLL